MGHTYSVYLFVPLQSIGSLTSLQLELGWGVATICTASVKSYKALYALRFLVGLLE